jgi:hypothetical protein
VAAISTHFIAALLRPFRGNTVAGARLALRILQPASLDRSSFVRKNGAVNDLIPLAETIAARLKARRESIAASRALGNRGGLISAALLTLGVASSRPSKSWPDGCRQPRRQGSSPPALAQVVQRDAAIRRRFSGAAWFVSMIVRASAERCGTLDNMDSAEPVGNIWMGSKGSLGEDRPGPGQFPETGDGPDAIVRRLDSAQAGPKNEH